MENSAQKLSNRSWQEMKVRKNFAVTEMAPDIAPFYSSSTASPKYNGKRESLIF